MSKALTLSGIIMAGVVVAGILWLRWEKGGGSRNAARTSILVVSGDTAGWITPCGCTANQSGGLLRRGTFLTGLQKEADVLYADVGGAPSGVSDYQRLKFEAVLRGEIAMNVRAHNIGGPEAALGPVYLRDVSARLSAPFVCANAHDASGAAIAPSMRIVETGHRRIALVGVLSPRYATSELTIENPRTAILSALAAATGKYDAVVVLAYLPEEELSQLATELPEADAVIGGPTGQAIAPRPVGPAMVAAATNKGKFLVKLNVPASASAGGSTARWDGAVVELGPTISDDPGQVDNLHKYQDALHARDFAAADTGLVPALPPDAPPAYRVAGSAACVACHAFDNNIWAHTAHASAWHTLKPRGFDADPYCLQCHTTGYGLPGGFESVRRTPVLGGVGCENCHGPSTAHVRDAKVHTSFAASSQCVQCHDHENSPHFAYDAYWPRILHGKKSQGSTLPSASAPEDRAKRFDDLLEAAGGGRP